MTADGDLRCSMASEFGRGETKEGRGIGEGRGSFFVARPLLVSSTLLLSVVAPSVWDDSCFVGKEMQQGSLECVSELPEQQNAVG